MDMKIVAQSDVNLRLDLQVLARVVVGPDRRPMEASDYSCVQHFIVVVECDNCDTQLVSDKQAELLVHL